MTAITLFWVETAKRTLSVSTMYGLIGALVPNCPTHLSPPAGIDHTPRTVPHDVAFR